MSSEPIPNLYPPVCPECESSAIYQRDRQTTRKDVAGFNEAGELEFLPGFEWLDGGECILVCDDCDWEGAEDELADATFTPEEGGDGSAPPF